MKGGGEYLAVIKSQLWQLINRVPECFAGILGYRPQFLLPVYADQRVISDRDHPALRVAVYLTKRMKLLHVQIAQTSQLVQNTFSSIVDAFILFNNVTRQRKPVFKWFLISLNEQDL